VNPQRLLAYISTLTHTRKFSFLVGNGSATQFDLTHNLNSDVYSVDVYEAAGAKRKVETSVEQPNLNTARVIFGTAPTLNQYRVVIIG